MEDAKALLAKVIPDQVAGYRIVLDKAYDIINKLKQYKDAPLPKLFISAVGGDTAYIISQINNTNVEPVTCITIAGTYTAATPRYVTDRNYGSDYYAWFATEEEAKICAYHVALQSFQDNLREAGIEYDDYKLGRSAREIEEAMAKETLTTPVSSVTSEVAAN